ncbi:unnamed protein product [Agarophyton chilense]
MEVFMKNFTFVTDCASNVLRIVPASSLSQRVPFSEKWKGCLSHQLNTAMKHVVNIFCPNSVIVKDVISMKTLVRIFKHENWNNELPDGFVLIQVVKTRFGTTKAVVERCVAASQYGAKVISCKESAPEKKAFESFFKGDDEGNLRFPALIAVPKASTRLIPTSW